MKKAILLFLVSAMVHQVSFAQVVEFSDDFESGTGNWILIGLWATTTTYSNSPSNSLTESPAANYGDNVSATATMLTGVDLTGDLDANLTFYAIYDIELGFDYMYLEASIDGGGTWTQLDRFDGEGNLSPWVQYSYSLGGFVGNSDVRIRFRFASDGALTFDGMYIDDFEITSSNVDNAGPLILHTGPEHYQGTLGDYNISAEVIDISGIATTGVAYTVDGGAIQQAVGTLNSGSFYDYTIPAQAPGAWVEYVIVATDLAPSANVGATDTMRYISGNYIAYDNAVVSFVANIGPVAPATYNSCAVQITLTGSTDLVTALIRNYTDGNRPNADMEIHVWADDGSGLPGADLITPFMVTPEATLTNTRPMTRVDLRPYSAQLSQISGEVFIGYAAPVADVWTTLTQPGVAGRTFAHDGNTWILFADDFHFRAITSAMGNSIEDLENGVSLQVFPNPMANETNIWIDSEKPLKNIRLELVNMLGQSIPVDYTVGSNQILLNRGNIPSGIYIFKVIADNEVIGGGRLMME